MERNEIIDAARNYIEELFSFDFGGHDAQHSIRVYHNACLIADTECECDRFVVQLAAILHDVDDHKLFQITSNEHARTFLKSHKLDECLIDRICEIINGISFSKNRGIHPSSLEGQIVQDADRLDAIGAIGIARTFAFGGERKRPLHATVDHFYEKLLLLKDEMNTNEGKRIAEYRHELMQSFLTELEKDLSGQIE